MEYARREARNGKNVLVVCFNRLLGKWLGDELRLTAPRSSITANSFHRFLDTIISLGHNKSDIMTLQKNVKQDELFRQIYPVLALEAIGEGVLEQFDVLVVDEGQDLIRPEYLDVLEALLKGGLAGEKWAFFCDFHGQAIYADSKPPEMLSEIDRRIPSYARFNLTINCRNTRPIGEETALISGFSTSPFLPASIEGVPVEYRFYKDIENARIIIREILGDLIENGIAPHLISILSTKMRAQSCITTPTSGLDLPIVDLDANYLGKRKKNEMTFSTIHAFMGLENAIIIIADIEHLIGDPYRSLLYTGMSRARHRLFVVVARWAKEEYNAILRRRAQSRGKSL